MNDNLDFIGILQGTDKSSIGHGYLRHYEELLEPLRHEPITLLEIGVFRGASLKMWSEYFETATIVGVDIQEHCRQFATDRCKVEIGSQADPDFLDAIGRKWHPNVIIDDGSHHADHVLLTFQALYPHLQESGLYIVEDVHFHGGRFAHLWRGSADQTPLEYFSRITTAVACPDICAEADRALVHSIDSVQFFYGGIATRKKSAGEQNPVERRKPIVERADRSELWSAFAVYVMNNTKDFPYSESCARRAIQLDPQRAEYHHVLGLVLERAGNVPGAYEAAEQAVRLQPSQEQFTARVRDLKLKL